MTLLPVIGRELRASARQSFSYTLRVLGVLAVLLVLGLYGLDEDSLGTGSGGKLFGYVHTVLFLAIWVLAPLLTADSISRERREGTLALLFLTPLRPHHIVYAKGAAHGLRAFTLWLAVLPVMAICFLVGGVAWPEVAISVLVNFSSICLALAAGLLGSAFSKVWARAMALGLLLAFGTFLLFMMILPPLIELIAGVGIGFTDWAPSPAVGFALSVNWDNMWGQGFGTRTVGPRLIWAFANAALFAVLCLILLVRLAAWNVRRTWREEPPSARIQWLRKKMFTPILFQALLHRWLNWRLRRNPIGWLEQRNWSGRLVVWSWFAVVICIYTSLFANLYIYQRGFHVVQFVLGALLAASIALSAAGSFRRERESGVLELLLVAPLREHQIIVGRVAGIWSQFLPAIALLFAVWVFGATFMSTVANEFPSLLLFALTFATLPIVGLYFSLKKSNYIVALLWTLAVQFLLPTMCAQALNWFLGPFNTPQDSDSLVELALFAPPQLLFAAWLAWRLHENLKYRKFALVARGAG